MSVNPREAARCSGVCRGKEDSQQASQQVNDCSSARRVQRTGWLCGVVRGCDADGGSDLQC